MNPVSTIYFFLSLTSGLLLSHLFPLPKGLKIMIGPALGIIFTTCVMFLVSLLFGFSVSSILVSLFISLVISLLIYKRFSSKKIAENFSIKNHWPLFLILGTIGIYSFYVFITQVLAPQPYGWTTGGGGLYGDTALHSAYTMSIVEQGVLPKNPLFAGQPLIYPFLVNLFSASLVLLGTSLRFAFVLPQLMYFMAFVGLFYFVAKQFTSQKGTFLAMLLFFLGWGFGFINYMNDSRMNGNWLPTREYTNDMQDYHLHNPLTGLIFPERSFLPGLVIGLLITSLMLNILNNNSPLPPLILRGGEPALQVRGRYLLIGLLLGILPLWHTHTFLFFGIAIGIWIVSQLLSFDPPAGGENYFLTSHFVRRIKQCIYIYIPALFIALPILWWFGSQISHTSFIHFSFGWIKNQNQLLFWLKNAGLILPLAFLGSLFVKKQIKLFFVAPLMLFFVANFFIFSPWEWDNIKILTWVFLFFSILAGHAIVSISQKGMFMRILMATCVVFSITSGILSLIHQTRTTYTIYDQKDIELAQWIQKNTESTDVFLVDPWPNHPVPGLTGRSVYLGYPGHLWVHGILYETREEKVKKILAGDVQLLSQTEVLVNFIVTKSQDKELFSKFPLVFENSKFIVLQIN